MFGPVFLFFLLVILVVWFISAGGRGFVRNAAELLEQPLVMRSRVGSFLSGWHQVKGSYEGRPAALALQERRSRYELAYLMAAMEAVGPLVSLGDNTGAFQDSIADRDGRRALYDLTVKHEVSLKLDGRWLTATWMPVGFTVVRFDRHRWQGILAAMRIVVRSLEHEVTLGGPERS